MGSYLAPPLRHAAELAKSWVVINGSITNPPQVITIFRSCMFYSNMDGLWSCFQVKTSWKNGECWLEPIDPQEVLVFGETTTLNQAGFINPGLTLQTIEKLLFGKYGFREWDFFPSFFVCLPEGTPRYTFMSDNLNPRLFQWEFQDPEMEVLYRI